MARKGHGRSADLVNLSSYPDDGSSPVGSNEWNKNRDTTGIIGFTKKTEAIDGSNNINITDSYVEVTNAGTIHTMSQVTTALSTTYYPSDTTTKSFAEGDLLYIVKASGVGTVNLNHQQGGAGAGKITTLSGGVQTLDEKVPRIFMCRTIGSNQEWIEYGGGSASDLDTTNFTAATIVTESDTIASNDNDTTIPTSAAVKDYVDSTPVGDITSVVAGSGLTGGGTSADVTLNVIGGTGITANADDIAIDSTVTTLTGSQTLTNKTLTAPTLTTPALGTPASGALTNCTALPAAQVAQGTMASGMVLVAPALGTPASGALTNCTAIPSAQLTGTIADARMPDLTGEVTTSAGAVATIIVNDIVDEANLKVDNTPTDDYVLTAKSSASGGLTWAAGGGGDEATPVLQASSYSAANQSPSTEGTHKVSIFTKTIDSNNQGLYVRVKKNGAYEDVQIG